MILQNFLDCNLNRNCLAIHPTKVTEKEIKYSGGKREGKTKKKIGPKIR
jgi:hypothetical protein